MQDESSHKSYGQRGACILLRDWIVCAFLQSVNLASISLLKSHKNVVCDENYRDDHLGHVVDLEKEHSLLDILPNVLATLKVSINIDHSECLLQISLAVFFIILTFEVIGAIVIFLTIFVAARKQWFLLLASFAF